MMPPSFDLLTLGRVGMDLFSEQIGSAFEDIESFSAGIGGSPTNIAIAASRLGLSVAAVTGVGDDKVADFVLYGLEKEAVDTRYVKRVEGARTGLAVVGVEPPASFPLTFYRENPADIHVGPEDVEALPLASTRCLLISGTALASEPIREASLLAAERMRGLDGLVVVDLDLRLDQWRNPVSYGLNVRTLLPFVDVVLGTEEEFYAALLAGDKRRKAAMNAALRPEEGEQLESALMKLSASDERPRLLVLKRGGRGVSLFERHGCEDVPGFAVEVVNTVGAGDAFAGGFIYGLRQDWSHERSAAFANACGALVVSRQGCSSAMPRLSEVRSFMETRGGKA